MLHFISQLTWRPEIGDPSIMGWITVAAYFVTSIVAVTVAFGKKAVSNFRFWIFLAVLLALLGINKQLDLQSLFTDIGRVFAKNNGWYDNRREVQAVFVTMVFTVTLIGTLLAVWIVRKNFKHILLPLTGFLLLVGFIGIRAISFHHVDALLKTTIENIRMNWIFELGGIGIILASGLRALVKKGASSRVA
jgi:hypothetical protein